jgi:hypothetical protein
MPTGSGLYCRYRHFWLEIVPLLHTVARPEHRGGLTLAISCQSGTRNTTTLKYCEAYSHA